LSCRFGSDSLLAFRFIQKKTVRIHCVSEMFSPDENSRRARTGEHSPEITAHRAGTDNCNSRPI
jgi:hypothetical protein